MTFRDRIEFLEPQILNDAFNELKHYYEKAKCRLKLKAIRKQRAVLEILKLWKRREART